MEIYDVQRLAMLKLSLPAGRQTMFITQYSFPLSKFRPCSHFVLRTMLFSLYGTSVVLFLAYRCQRKFKKKKLLKIIDNVI